MSFITRPFSWGILGLLLSVSILTAGTAVAIAQQAPGPSLHKASNPIPPSPARADSNALTIKIETSRSQIVPDTPMGISADLTNNSEAPIFLRQRDVQLVMPPEYYGGTGLTAAESWFPTEYCELKNPLSCPANFTGLSIKPGETYRVFWARQKPPQTEGSWYRRIWDRFRDVINFAPGQYPIAVDAKYWDAPDSFDSIHYHTAVQSVDAQIVAPEGTILWGAGLGGVIFTTLILIRNRENRPTLGSSSGTAGPFLMGSLQILGSILLSIIATILLSRIEQTQFFIKITVSDFWGAIAMGFLANYGGWKLLDKIAGAPGKETADSRTSSDTHTPLVPGASPSH